MFGISLSKIFTDFTSYRRKYSIKKTLPTLRFVLHLHPPIPFLKNLFLYLHQYFLSSMVVGWGFFQILAYIHDCCTKLAIQSVHNFSCSYISKISV